MPTAWNFYQVAFERTTPIDRERSKLHLLTLIGSPQENKRSDSGCIKSFT